MSSRTFLVVLALLLLLIVGPLFGPVPVYLVTTLDVRAAATWLITLFLVTTGIVFGIAATWLRRTGRTLADLGWRQPSTLPALIVGTLVGLFWGVFGTLGYLQFVPNANVFEISGFRLFTALGGAGLAILEDLLTRGLVMNELHRLKIPSGWQVGASSLLFALYHTVWGFNLFSFVFSLGYGLILAGLFVFGKRSLTPVILGHSLALLIGESFLTLSLLEAIKLALG